MSVDVKKPSTVKMTHIYPTNYDNTLTIISVVAIAIIFITWHEPENESSIKRVEEIKKNPVRHGIDNLHRLTVVMLFWILGWSWYNFLADKLDKLGLYSWPGMIVMTLLVLIFASFTCTDFKEYI